MKGGKCPVCGQLCYGLNIHLARAHGISNNIRKQEREARKLAKDGKPVYSRIRRADMLDKQLQEEKAKHERPVLRHKRTT